MGGGGGRYSVACLGHLTIDHAYLQRRGNVRVGGGGFLAVPRPLTSIDPVTYRWSRSVEITILFLHSGQLTLVTICVVGPGTTSSPHWSIAGAAPCKVLGDTDCYVHPT